MEEHVNNWKWFEVVSKIFTLMIPVVLFYFGNEIKKSQDENNREQQNLNRTATLLKSLSSENQVERKLAMRFSEHLAANGDFPEELIEVMGELYASDTAISDHAGDILDVITNGAAKENDTVLLRQIKRFRPVQGERKRFPKLVDPNVRRLNPRVAPVPSL